MDDTYKQIEAARASSEVFFHHPEILRFSYQARKIDDKKFQWLLDSMCNYGYKAHEEVISKYDIPNKDLLLGSAHHRISTFSLNTLNLQSSSKELCFRRRFI